jgi:hypothetical protein
VLAFCFSVVALSSIGLPGLNGFTGEILSIMGMFHHDWISKTRYGFVGLTGIILGAWYMLWLVQRTYFGRLREPVVEGHGDHSRPADLNSREIFALAPILVLIVWIGVYPQFFIRRMEPSISRVVEKLNVAKFGFAARSSPLRVGWVERREAHHPASRWPSHGSHHPTALPPGEGSGLRDVAIGPASRGVYPRGITFSCPTPPFNGLILAERISGDGRTSTPATGSPSPDPADRSPAAQIYAQAAQASKSNVAPVAPDPAGVNPAAR